MAKRNEKPASVNDYASIKAEIRSGSFSSFYVLHGEEWFLISSVRSSIRKKIIGASRDSFDYHPFDSDSWNVQDFCDAVDAYPMAGERSLIELNDVSLFDKECAENDLLADYLANLPDYVTIVAMYETVVWKPDRSMKALYEAVNSSAKVYKIDKQPDSVMLPWVQKSFASEGKTISNRNAQYLLEITGGLSASVMPEIEKLSSYSEAQEITREDIDAMVISSLETEVFRLTDDLSQMKFDSALSRLAQLEAQNENPIGVCTALSNRVRRLYAAKVLSAYGKGPDALASLFGMNTYPAGLIYRQAGSYELTALNEAMRLCAEADLSMKSTGRDGFEILRDMVFSMTQLFRKERR